LRTSYKRLWVFKCGDGIQTTSDILKEIKELLEEEGELSIRQIALEIKAQWRTAHDALHTLVDLGIVKEKKGGKSKRKERVFSLK
jgi:Mn-dependent DtxR family transcriptional regulator